MPAKTPLWYTLRRWKALPHHLADDAAPIDNNHLKRQIKSWAMGRKAWMFVSSEPAGQRAATVLSLVQSARLNGHDALAYFSDVLRRLPMQLSSRIEELLPHRWAPATHSSARPRQGRVAGRSLGSPATRRMS